MNKSKKFIPKAHTSDLLLNFVQSITSGAAHLTGNLVPSDAVYWSSNTYLSKSKQRKYCVYLHRIKSFVFPTVLQQCSFRQQKLRQYFQIRIVFILKHKRFKRNIFFLTKEGFDNNMSYSSHEIIITWHFLPPFCQYSR